MNKKKIGNIGESIAASYYEILGFKLLKQNYFTKYGELDLIVVKNKKLRFIEVKTRTNTETQDIYEQIHQKKISNIKKSLGIFLQKENIRFKDIYMDFVFINLSKDLRSYQLEILTLD